MRATASARNVIRRVILQRGAGPYRAVNPISKGGLMVLNLHASRRAVSIAETIAAGAFATGVGLLSVITAATLIYVLFVG